LTAGRLHADTFVGRDGGRKAPAGKPDETKVCSVIAIDRYPNLRRSQYFQILLFNFFQISQKAGEAGIISTRPSYSTTGRDQYPIQHIGVEDTGLGHGSKSQSDDDFLNAATIVARKAEDVLEIGGTDINIREDRIYCVRVVVVRHNSALPSPDDVLP
jgi:hypothetical protein